MIPLVVVPIARAENAERMIHAWAYQSRVSVLMFAPAPGVEIASSLRPTRTIGEARNAGIEYARRQGFEVVIFWDDDNHYGFEYVGEFVRAFDLDPGLAVAYKGLGFVRHDDGLWSYDDARTHFYPGHCSAVRVRDAVEFPAASYAEDVAWSRAMAGRPSVRLSPWHLVYDRRRPASHAYNAEREVFLRQHGPARFLGDLADERVDRPFRIEAPWQRVSDDDIFAAMRRAVQ